MSAPRRKLRSNLEPGTALWAGRRAQWRALGLSDEDMLKPKIAIINSSSELSSCFSHLDGISAELKKVIRAAGGLPLEVRPLDGSPRIGLLGNLKMAIRARAGNRSGPLLVCGGIDGLVGDGLSVESTACAPCMTPVPRRTRPIASALYLQSGQRSELCVSDWAEEGAVTRGLL